MPRNLAWLLETLTRRADALERFGDKAPSAIYLMQGTALRKLGRLEEADVVAKRGKERFPYDVELAMEACEIAMARRDWVALDARCGEVLKQAGEKAPPRVYVMSAIAQRKLGDFRALEQTLQQGRKHHSTNAKLTHEFVKSARVRCDWAATIARASEALDCLGQDAPASIYLMSSDAYRNLGELAAAEAVTCRGEERFPEEVLFSLEAAEIALAQRDWAKAIKTCERIFDSYGENARARALMALAHYNLADQNIDAAMSAPDCAEGIKRLNDVIETYGHKLPSSFFEEIGSDEQTDLTTGHWISKQTPDAVFIWIPKTAGTSVFNALAAAGCLKLKTPELVQHAFSGKGLVTFSHMSYKLLVKEGYVSENFDRTAKKFTFVRHPFSRAVSLYFYVQRYLLTYNKQPSFLEFLELIETGLYDRVGLYNVKNLSQCNPQVRWLDGIKLDFVGKMECIEEDFIALQDALNLKLPTLGMYKAGIYRDPYSLFGKREKYLVEKIYEEDFAAFGYDTSLRG